MDRWKSDGGNNLEGKEKEESLSSSLQEDALEVEWVRFLFCKKMFFLSGFVLSSQLAITVSAFPSFIQGMAGVIRTGDRE